MPKVLLQLNDIYKRFGAQVILDGAGAAFQENQKIAMIGRNGAGKSTLCKIITGHETADAGEVTKSQDLRLSYLEQHDPYDLEETVMGFLTRYTGKEDWQCGETAGRFQLKGPILQQRIAELSGGYRTRVKLTSMLLGDPNFLILDEPTNYLDLKTLILLENFLQDWDGAFLVVSHDREFLKRTCEDTLEVENGDMTLYPGSVEEYLTFKAEQKAQALSTNRNIEAKKKQLQLFVDRFRAKASKASQARSKMKQIEKLKTIEIGHALGNVHIKIPPVQVRGGIALRCENLTIGYPDKTVARKIHLEIDQGAHVAVLGDNGQGKTTFLRTIAGGLESKGGVFKWGNNLQVAYYAQHVSQSLHPGQDVFTHLYDMAAPGVTRQEIMNLAGSFLFRGEDTKKPIGVLSGGEKARVCLAGLLLTKSQVIILDEPTNHLDFETVEALGRALKSFSGTLFFVSHDRTFVNLVANQIIEVNNGNVVRYPGTYEDYVYYLSNRIKHDMHPEIPLEEEEVSAPQVQAETPPPVPEVDAEKTKALQADKKKYAARLKKSEKLLAEYRDEVGITEQDFADDAEARTPLRIKRQAFLAAAIEKEEQSRQESSAKLAELQNLLKQGETA